MKKSLTPSKKQGMEQNDALPHQGVDASAIPELICAGSDFSLQLNKLGEVLSYHCPNSVLQKDLLIYGAENWSGRTLDQLVTIESKPKILACLRESAGRKPDSAAMQWRQVNLPRSDGIGPDLPIELLGIRINADGKTLILAKDLRSLASLQQNLIATQQTMEKDYLALRFVDARYRALMYTSTCGIALVDAVGLRIHEANEVAFTLLGETSKRKTTKSLTEYFDADAKLELSAWLNKLNAARSGQGAIELLLKSAIRSQVRQKPVHLRLQASMIRQAEGLFYLVWIEEIASELIVNADARANNYTEVFDHLPDGVVVTDQKGLVLHANSAFANIVQLADASHAIGENLSRWLARGELDFGLVENALKQSGTFKQMSTEVKGDFGSATAVEISGVSVEHNHVHVFGLSFRDVRRRASGVTESERVMPRSISELKELVGRVSLKDIVGETTDVIEQLCIEAALEITGDNRAAASEMLGLSRQSLYVKLRRFGVDTSADSDLGNRAN